MISPSVVLLLPIVYTAAFSGWRATAVTGLLAVLYQFRHYSLNRGEYVSPGMGVSLDDVSRILLFAVAALGLVAIARYREEQRRIQLSLEAAYRAAVEADRAKTQFLAVISHELRTPLTAIIQYTDLMNAGIGGEVNRDQREMLQRIEHGALHLRGLIQRLLDYAHLGRGEATVYSEPTDLVQLVDQAVAMLEPMAAARGLALSAELPGAPLPVETDPDRARQIVLNLVENAIKFTDRGSVTVRLRAELGAYVLEVADTGVGIPEAAVPRIFEPFWQGEDALTRRRGGLGLGLAITRELVVALGGEIRVESREGAGSVFTVVLPRDSPRSTPPGPH